MIIILKIAEILVNHLLSETGLLPIIVTSQTKINWIAIFNHVVM